MRFDDPSTLEYQCKNRECQTHWSHKPDTWKCQAAGCDIECCEEIGCKRNCAICDLVFCHVHSVVRNGEPVCADCLILLIAGCSDVGEESRL